MYEYSGKCSCGEVQVKLSLPKTLSNYSPRVCDCDFCKLQKLEYLSDPHGQITLSNQFQLKCYKQSSGQASFLRSPLCQTFLLTTYTHKNNRLASLNATVLEQYCELQPPTTISPKLLSSTDKVNRWQQLWSKLLTLS